jgi:hypothetical protein
MSTRHAKGRNGIFRVRSRSCLYPAQNKKKKKKEKKKKKKKRKEKDIKTMKMRKWESTRCNLQERHM